MNQEDSAKIVAEFQKRFRIAESAESKNREIWKKDRRFVYHDEAQWEDSGRDTDRPKVTVNRLQVFARNIVNEARESPVSLKVHPVDQFGDKHLANVVSGLLRNTEHTSNAEDEYASAFEDAVTGGYGELRILVDYESPESFQLAPKIVYIKDPNTVLRDPFYQDPTGADAKWTIVFTRIDKEEFEEEWPDAPIADVRGDSISFWADKKDGVLIAEYFVVEEKEEKLYLFEGGKTEWDSNLTAARKKKAIDSRKSCRKRVVWYKIGGGGILEGPVEFPASSIPIVRMPGREWFEDGKRLTCGAIHYAKDAQKIYNYARSQQIERLALAPKAPFIGYAGQFTDPKWKTLNRRNWPYLEVDPVTIEGNLAPLPQRQQMANLDPALTEEIQISSEEIKATTGIFDANLGAKSNEASGRAILARQQQGNRANADFVSNRNKAIRQVGALLMEIYANIYDEARCVRILGPDGNPDLVWLNKEYRDRDGVTRLYDLSAAKFDIVLDVGPSYATKRQETAVAMTDSLRNLPIIGQVAPDLYVQAQDWPDADKIAERVKRTIPPQILGKDADEQQQQNQPPPVPPELLQRMQELEQENGQLKQQETIKLAELELEKYKVDEDNKTKIEVALIGAGKELHKEHISQSGETARHAAQTAAESAQASQAGMENGQGIAPDSED